MRRRKNTFDRNSLIDLSGFFFSAGRRPWRVAAPNAGAVIRRSPGAICASAYTTGFVPFSCSANAPADVSAPERRRAVLRIVLAILLPIIEDQPGCALPNRRGAGPCVKKPHAEKQSLAQ